MEVIARGVGRRKEAVAQIQIVKSTEELPGGQFLINNIPAENYLHNNTCSLLSIKAPLNVLNGVHDSNVEDETSEKSQSQQLMDNGLFYLNDSGSFNTIVKVKGGGLVGQAEAIKLGLARAICQFYSKTSTLAFSERETRRNFVSSIGQSKELNSIETSLTFEESGIKKPTMIGYESEIRKQYKDKGYLTQDSRVKERRKYGLKKARKASQYHKR